MEMKFTENSEGVSQAEPLDKDEIIDIGIPRIINQKKDGSYMVHDQVLHFKDGTKRYAPRIKYIWENEMTHLLSEDGTEYIIVKANLNFIERRLKFENDKL